MAALVPSTIFSVTLWRWRSASNPQTALTPSMARNCPLHHSYLLSG
jgi:hypothetical protein